MVLCKLSFKYNVSVDSRFGMKYERVIMYLPAH